jgi:hypothetical protein
MAGVLRPRGSIEEMRSGRVLDRGCRRQPQGPGGSGEAWRENRQWTVSWVVVHGHVAHMCPLGSSLELKPVHFKL